MEDDRRLATSIRRSLGEAGVTVDVVVDGEEGLSAALGTPFDVLILDVMVPRINGLDVARRLRDKRVETPILMLTARDSIDDRVRGLRLAPTTTWSNRLPSAS